MDVLKLFEGLTFEQASAMLKRIVPELERIRAEVTSPPSFKEQADEVLESAIHDIMDRDGVTYPEAVYRLQKEEPVILEKWQSIRNMNVTTSDTSPKLGNYHKTGVQKT